MPDQDESAHGNGPVTIGMVPVEDVARWLERQVRVGNLSARICLADALRDGTWRAMPVRATADRDVPEARAWSRFCSRRPLTAEDLEALNRMRQRAVDKKAREQRTTDRITAAIQDAHRVPDVQVPGIPLRRREQ